jgi:hypothetical protein
MRTTFPKEIEGASVSAQFPHNFPECREHELRFPMAVKHRHAKVIIYKKTAKYPFYRIAYHAGGHRIVRSFKTYGEAKREAKRIAKQISKGNIAASLTNKDALAYKFAITNSSTTTRGIIWSTLSQKEGFMTQSKIENRVAECHFSP